MLYSTDCSILCLVTGARERLLQLVQLILFVGPQKCWLHFIVYFKHILYVCSNLHYRSGLCGSRTSVYFCTGPRNVLKRFCLYPVYCFVKRLYFHHGENKASIACRNVLLQLCTFPSYVHIYWTHFISETSCST